MKKKDSLFYFFLLVCSLSLLKAFSSESLPYKANCSKGQKQRTLQFIPVSTEATYCFECSPKEQQTLLKLKKDIDDFFSKTKTIPKKCFLAIAVRGNKIFDSRYRYCSNENNVNFLEGRDQKFCINNDYITAVYKAFKKMSYCFNFDKKTQEDIFLLINRESGGILNTRSPSFARCLGQITKDYVTTINTSIEKADNKNPHSNSFIWNNFVNRCPDLKSLRIKEKTTLNCQASQNPQLCLLYSFFGNARSLHNIQKRLDSPHDYMGNQEFPSAEDLMPEEATTTAKKRYQSLLELFPIKRKEMIVMKITVKTGEEKTWVIWDDSEIYNGKLHKKIDWTKPVNIKKVNIFENERDIKTMFMYWAHSGGGSLSRGGFTARLKRLKQSIARGGCDPLICQEIKKNLEREICKENQESKCQEMKINLENAGCNPELRCQMRRKLEKGERISNSLAEEFFQRDLKQTLEHRKLEVGNYVRNIFCSRSQAFDNREGSSTYKTLESYYKNNKIDKNVAKNFIEETDKNCPQALKDLDFPTNFNDANKCKFDD